MTPKMRNFLRKMLLLTGITFALATGFHVYQSRLDLLYIDLLGAIAILTVFALTGMNDKTILEDVEKE